LYDFTTTLEILKISDANRSSTLANTIRICIVYQIRRTKHKLMDTTNKWRYRFCNQSLVTGRVVWYCALQVLADTFAGFGFVLGRIGVGERGSSGTGGGERGSSGRGGKVEEEEEEGGGREQREGGERASAWSREEVRARRHGGYDEEGRPCGLLMGWLEGEKRKKE
jgi:hypothetical protein